jgi:hypothetical protein
MARTAWLIYWISTASDHRKNALRRASASSRHITKLEQSTFIRYLLVQQTWRHEHDLFTC